MRRAQAIAIVILAVSLAGCSARGKHPVVAAVPAPPQPVPAAAPRPLSIPQTRAEDLPPDQPISPGALATAPPVEMGPATPQVVRTPARPPARTPPKTDPTPAAAPAEPSRPPVQEVLSPQLQAQLRSSAQNRRAQVRTLVEQASRRRLNNDQNNLLKTIDNFVKLSEDAERSGDLRSADEMAGRAYSLAKELQNGK